MRKIALTAALGALLLLPGSALAAETSYVAAGVLTYTSALGQADAVSVGNGVGPYAGKIFLSETQSPSGSVGAGCTPVSGEPTVVCSGVTSLDLQPLDGNDFVTVFNALPANIDGGAGADTIWGGFGNDTITGGTQADDIRGGGGDDRIYAQDGAVDTIDCGDGDDRAFTDANDVVSNCEVDPPVVVEEPVVDTTPIPDTKKKVDVPKADTPAGPKADEPKAEPRAIESPLPAVSPLEIVAGAVKVGRDGAAPLTLGCAATEVNGCSGNVFLDPALAASKSAKRGKGSKGNRKVRALAARRGRFGRSPFQIAAGKKKNLKVQLTTEARRKLGLPTGKRAKAARRGRRVKAVVTVVQRGKKAQTSVIELHG